MFVCPYLRSLEKLQEEIRHWRNMWKRKCGRCSYRFSSDPFKRPCGSRGVPGVLLRPDEWQSQIPVCLFICLCHHTSRWIGRDLLRRALVLEFTVSEAPLTFSIGMCSLGIQQREEELREVWKEAAICLRAFGNRF